MGSQILPEEAWPAWSTAQMRGRSFRMLLIHQPVSGDGVSAADGLPAARLGVRGGPVGGGL